MFFNKLHRLIRTFYPNKAKAFIPHLVVVFKKTQHLVQQVFIQFADMRQAGMINRFKGNCYYAIVPFFLFPFFLLQGLQYANNPAFY